MYLFQSTNYGFTSVTLTRFWTSSGKHWLILLQEVRECCSCSCEIVYFIFNQFSLSVSLSLYIYIYMCVCVCVCEIVGFIFNQFHMYIYLLIVLKSQRVSSKTRRCKDSNPYSGISPIMLSCNYYSS